VLIALALGLRLPSLLAKDEGQDARPQLGPRPLPVETLTVEALSAYQISRAYTGLIVARRSSDLSFERVGKLVDLALDEGARVTPGMPLATLDTQELHTTRRELLAQRAQATARLAEMRAGPRPETIAAARALVQERREELAMAQLRHTRRQELWAKRVIAREELDEADASVNTWQARLDAAQRQLDELLAGTRREQIQAQEALVAQLQAQLAALDINLEKSVLKAPFAGTVAARLVDEGTVLMAGQAVLRLVEDTHLEARVGVPPHIAASMPSGSEQRLQIDQTLYTARVAALLPEVEGSTRTLTVVLTLPQTAVGAVVHGQVVRLHWAETVADAGFWLPTTALSKGERGLWSCFALVQESQGETPFFRVERRAIEILHTENDRVFVRGLLQSGERVVKSGTHRVVADQYVRPVTSL
jgi:RND family efflux transporter MFP subunit